MAEWQRSMTGGDLVKQFEALNATGWFAEKGKEMRSLFERLAIDDVEAAMQCADAVHGRIYREGARNTLLHSIANTVSFAQAANIAADHYPESLPTLLRTWGLTEPAELMRFLEQSEHLIEYDELVSVGVTSWAEKDLKAATQWIVQQGNKLSEDAQRSLMLSILSDGAKHDPEFTARMALEHLTGGAADHVLSGAMATWAQRDTKTVVEWSYGLEAHIKAKVQKSLVEALAGQNLAVAEQVAHGLDGKESKVEAISHIASARMQADGIDAAIRWAEGLEGPYRTRAIVTIGRRTADENVAEATNLMLQRPLPQQQQSAFLNGIADRIFSTDVAAGVQWVRTLPPVIRESVLPGIMERNGHLLGEEQTSQLTER